MFSVNFDLDPLRLTSVLDKPFKSTGKSKRVIPENLDNKRKDTFRTVGPKPRIFAIGKMATFDDDNDLSGLGLYSKKPKFMPNSWKKEHIKLPKGEIIIHQKITPIMQIDTSTTPDIYPFGDGSAGSAGYAAGFAAGQPVPLSVRAASLANSAASLASSTASTAGKAAGKAAGKVLTGTASLASSTASTAGKALAGTASAAGKALAGTASTAGKALAGTASAAGKAAGKVAGKVAGKALASTASAAGRAIFGSPATAPAPAPAPATAPATAPLTKSQEQTFVDNMQKAGGRKSAAVTRLMNKIDTPGQIENIRNYKSFSQEEKDVLVRYAKRREWERLSENIKQRSKEMQKDIDDEPGPNLTPLEKKKRSALTGQLKENLDDDDKIELENSREFEYKEYTDKIANDPKVSAPLNKEKPERLEIQKAVDEVITKNPKEYGLQPDLNGIGALIAEITDRLMPIPKSSPKSSPKSEDEAEQKEEIKEEDIIQDEAYYDKKIEQALKNKKISDMLKEESVNWDDLSEIIYKEIKADPVAYGFKANEDTLVFGHRSNMITEAIKEKKQKKGLEEFEEKIRKGVADKDSLIKFEDFHSLKINPVKPGSKKGFYYALIINDKGLVESRKTELTSSASLPKGTKKEGNNYIFTDADKGTTIRFIKGNDSVQEEV